MMGHGTKLWGSGTGGQKAQDRGTAAWRDGLILIRLMHERGRKQHPPLFFFWQGSGFCPSSLPKPAEIPESRGRNGAGGRGDRGVSSSLRTLQPERLGAAKFRVVVPLPVANWDQWHCHHAGAGQELPLSPTATVSQGGKVGRGSLDTPRVPTAAAPEQRVQGWSQGRAGWSRLQRGWSRHQHIPTQPHLHHGHG